MWKNKKVRYATIALVLLVIILAVAKRKGCIGGKEEIKVCTELVKRRTIGEMVSANGKIEPETEVKISPDVSGEIIDLYVKEGDKVKKGDLLAKINPDIYIAALDRMEASLNIEKANLSNSRARLSQVKAQFSNTKMVFDRTEKLWKQGVISEAEYEDAKSKFIVAQAEVDATEQNVVSSEYNIKSGEASLKEAKDNLNKTSVFAPIDGTVSKLSSEKGERVSGTSQFSAGTEIMTIADLNEMEVKVDVSENDIIRVNIGDTALIEIDSYLDREFKGIVTEIASSASTSGTSLDQVTNFVVKIRILKESYQDLLSKTNPNQYPFRPGMSASVDICTETVYNVLSVPLQAVTTVKDSSLNKKKEEDSFDDEVVVVKKDKKEDDQAKKNKKIKEYVFLYENGKVKRQEVKSGIQDNMYIEIMQGLKDKQEVVTGPYNAVSKTLKDGDKVKKVNKEQLFNE